MESRGNTGKVILVARAVDSPLSRLKTQESYPVGFLETRFLSGRENGRFSTDRGQNGRIPGFGMAGIASIFLQAAGVSVPSRG